jgi:NADH dehydrogenase [ubiquinone] 1 alpha subcomplex assembly factor 7
MSAPVLATPLEDMIARMIADEGPIGVDRYMGLALGHPEYGYYMRGDPFGAQGDFITAPEISQMFGELIGLWAAQVWHVMGRPNAIRLVELGPGRGTLMVDALRAAKALPAFRDAIDLHMVETSPALRERQKEALTTAGVLPATSCTWHDDIASLPNGPAIIIANEFFDALPIRQFVRDGDAWRERLIGLGREGKLAFGLSHEPEGALVRTAPHGTIIEVALPALTIAAKLTQRIMAQGGAMLIIDYGYVSATSAGDSLQAMHAHTFVDPLSRPGEADITAHVDFATLTLAGRKIGAQVHGPVTQGAFLDALGLSQRAEALRARANPAQLADIDAAQARLTDMRPAGMGSLFKVLAICEPELSMLPGFNLVMP